MATSLALALAASAPGTPAYTPGLPAPFTVADHSVPVLWAHGRPLSTADVSGMRTARPEDVTPLARLDSFSPGNRTRTRTRALGTHPDGSLRVVDYTDYLPLSAYTTYDRDMWEGPSAERLRCGSLTVWVQGRTPGLDRSAMWAGWSLVEGTGKIVRYRVNRTQVLGRPLFLVDPAGGGVAVDLSVSITAVPVSQATVDLYPSHPRPAQMQTAHLSITTDRRMRARLRETYEALPVITLVQPAS